MLTNINNLTLLARITNHCIVRLTKLTKLYLRFPLDCNINTADGSFLIIFITSTVADNETLIEQRKKSAK